jgi:SAM-dependent methyltransferase
MAPPSARCYCLHKVVSISGRLTGSVVPENAGTKGHAQAGAEGWTRSGVDARELGPRRLRSLKRMCDDHSFATLGALGITPQLRCLEIGAGAGSVASWLAERVPQGEVVATELDIAFLPDGIANLHQLKHDVLTDDFAPASFDLIHSRAVFQVFPDAAAVLLRVIPWLRPGGWFVLEEIDGAPGLGSPLPELRRANALILDFLERVVGGDREHCRRVPMLLEQAGLAHVRASYLAHAVGAGSPAQDLIALSLAQLRPGAVRGGLGTEEEFDELDAWVAVNEVVDYSFVSISAWGRKPSGPGED